MGWPKPRPADFASVACTLTYDQLRQRFRVGTDTIRRWLEEAGIDRPALPAGQRRTARPRDFDARANDNVRNLCARYGVNKQVVRRWLAEVGVKRAPNGQAGARAKPRRPVVVGNIALRTRLSNVARDHRDFTQAGMAADYLRRFGPVVRCDPAGRYDPAGSHWRRGSTVLTAEEVVARAERNGWQPDAWKQVA